jgi:hypothetical protein
MTASMTSADLIAGAIEAYERFARWHVLEAADPEVGAGQAFECGRRALRARGAAEPWIVPPPVCDRVQHLGSVLEAAPADDAFAWIDRFPHAVLEALERRHPRAGPYDGPRRRFVDGPRAP